jgi:hypothetical protein
MGKEETMNWKATIICGCLVFLAIGGSIPAIPMHLYPNEMLKLAIFWAIIVAVCIGVFRITKKKSDSN